MNTKDKGDISEAAIALALMKHGYVVLRPAGDNQRYDLVIEKNGVFKTIQCKTGRLKSEGAKILFNAHSRSSGKNVVPKSYKGQVDYFGVYSPVLDKSYLVPAELVPETHGTLRLKPTLNHQTMHVMLASGYQL